MASFFDEYDVDLKDKRSIIGKGAFSTVHRCVNNRTGEVCAVKVIPVKTLKQSEISKIEREIRICSALRHDNIVQLRKAYRDDSTFYLVFEYISGGELFDEIVTRKSYNEKDASTCLHQILSGLDNCHQRKIIHRDLKPENLLLASRERDAPVKLTDFGLAVIMDAGPKYFGFAGTPGYLSPEVIRRTPYDEKVDVWACGVILYILLVGYPPFWEEDQTKLYEQIKACNYDFPSPEWDTVTESAKELITLMLDPNPAKRPSVRQCLQHPWLAQVDVPATVNRQETLDELRKFNARRKLKGGIKAVLTVGRMHGLLSQSTSDRERSDTITSTSSSVASASASTSTVDELNAKLLESVRTKDWKTFSDLCDPNVTGFEPDGHGVLLTGLEFHKMYFEQEGAQLSSKSTIVHSKTRVYGNAAVTVFTHLLQTATGAGVETKRFDETRMWVKSSAAKYGWKLVHFHKSATQ
eukprot:m.355872 g.355872  ORF g.355872 m.355872 type:complete len:467 (-) comp17368_c0_seq1:295-1695(-)